MIIQRPHRPDEYEFLYRVYASTRTEELAQVNWSAEEKEAFLRQQSQAQHYHYTTYYQSAEFNIIEQDGQPIGRIYINRTPQELRLMDIALLPEYRNQGIGTALMRELIAESDTKRIPITLHVEQFNPAYRLYQRLGFQDVEMRGVYMYMERKPS